MLELNISIEPGNAAESRFKLDGERTFEPSDATVIPKILTVDTVSAIIEYDAITDKSVNAEESLCLSYLFFAQDGNPLNAEYMMGAYGAEIDPIDGNWHLRFRMMEICCLKQ